MALPAGVSSDAMSCATAPFANAKTTNATLNQLHALIATFPVFRFGRIPMIRGENVSKAGVTTKAFGPTLLEPFELLNEPDIRRRIKAHPLAQNG